MERQYYVIMINLNDDKASGAKTTNTSSVRDLIMDECPGDFIGKIDIVRSIKLRAILLTVGGLKMQARITNT